ncbi:MAG TPA: DUF1572 family protein [Gemmatimonadaceae bacterium]|jgi:uncharacterized damage-inducible protein DinB|nr:DUF1572 family protein [Gemmatimonadaceae bacterium]
MTATRDNAPPPERDVATTLVALSRRYLREYLTKIRLSVSVLDDAVVWARPNEASNSIANLILHLAGNARQWIVSGVGGAVDVRNRQSEFDRRDTIPVSELIDRLEQTIIDVDRVLATVSPADLVTRRVIQNNDVTVLEAIYHVVEHFSMHTGQIILLAKAEQADRIRFYDMVDGHPRLTADFHGRTPVHPR